MRTVIWRRVGWAGRVVAGAVQQPVDGRLHLGFMFSIKMPYNTVRLGHDLLAASVVACVLGFAGDNNNLVLISVLSVVGVTEILLNSRHV